MLVEFEPVSHTYRINGCPAPGVTRVLGDQLEDFSMVDPEVLEAARVFGTHVHEAVHLWNIGELDWQSLDPLLVRPVEQWAEFIESNDITIVASEVMVAHPLHKYAGRLDTLAEWSNRLCLIDVKSGALPRTVGPQTAAYEQAYIAERPSARIQRRYCVQLTRDEDKPAKAHRLDNASDFSMFVSALNCWRFRYAPA